MIYTGVGSRKAAYHIEVVCLMTDIAVMLNKLGWTLRSGGADGADKAFEAGAGNRKEIYYARQATQAAMEIAARYHPAWNRCGDYAKMLHARNAFQVLGINLDTPSDGLLCWTPDGCTCHADRTMTTGGTGTAISIANAYGVPVTNLANNKDFYDWRRRVMMDKKND